jgi:hypothetical protein
MAMELCLDESVLIRMGSCPHRPGSGHMEENKVIMQMYRKTAELKVGFTTSWTG